jgi:sec-independent protein translocase protein TatA
MGEFSIYHWLIVVGIVVLLFGGRQIPELMRGIGEGIRSFRDGVRGTDGGTKAASVQPGAEKKIE